VQPLVNRFIWCYWGEQIFVLLVLLAVERIPNFNELIGMNHLIITAHPSENSFSNYLSKNIYEFYENMAWTVTVRDLYKINFNPVLSSNDLKLLKLGQTPFDIQREQKYLAAADLITVIYPLWWAGFPAILKGYIDRVLTNGFAFRYTQNGPEPLMKGKQVILHTTMGNTVEEYEAKGLIEAFRSSQGDEVFGYCGMEVIDHLFYPQITVANESRRNHFLEMALEAYQPVQTSRLF
jgi:NAD(P)H dehydrogenase (quinone)